MPFQLKQIVGVEEYSNKFLKIVHQYEKLYNMAYDRSRREETRLQEALEFSDAIRATAREPLVVIEKELKIIIANRRFF